MDVIVEGVPAGGSISGCSIYEKVMKCGPDWTLYKYDDDGAVWEYVEPETNPPTPCTGSGCHEQEVVDTIAF